LAKLMVFVPKAPMEFSTANSTSWWPKDLTIVVPALVMFSKGGRNI
jgi:hypothetical protein